MLVAIYLLCHFLLHQKMTTEASIDGIFGALQYAAL